MNRAIPFFFGLLLLCLPSIVEAACANPLGPAGGSTCSHVGSTWTCTDTGDDCNNGDAFNNALSNVVCGETIVLTAGVSFQTRVAFLNGNDEPQGSAFRLPNKGCGAGNGITIKSSALASMPAGTRVGPAQSIYMAQVATNSNSWVIDTAANAAYWTLQGLDLTNTAYVFPTHNGNTVQVVRFSADNYGEWPNHITLDRVWIHPYDDTTDPSRIIRTAGGLALLLNGENMTVTDSSITGFCCYQANLCPTNSNCAPSTLMQSVAIDIDIGPGPALIHNNLLEGYGWNLFTGGGTGRAGSPLVNPANTATVTGATSTQATFSQTATLLVGDYIAFVMYPPTQWTTTVACGSNPSFGYDAQVDTINSGTGLVTYHGVGCDSITDANTLGNPMPPDGYTVQWRGVAISGLTITQNTLSKRTDWCTSTYNQGKSVFEIKDGSNILFEGNQVLIPPFNQETGSNTGCLASDFVHTIPQDGTSPWTAGNNNVFRNNLFRGVGRHVALQPYPLHTSLPPTGPLTVTNNLFDGTARIEFLETEGGSGGGAGWLFEHNTVRGQTSAAFVNISGTALPTDGMILRNNIFTTGQYAINNNPVSSSFPNLVENHTVWIKSGGIGNPPWNGFTPDGTSWVVANDAAVGFVNVTDADAGGDYHGYQLTAVSPYHNAASDGKDVGVDFAALDAALGSGAPGGGGSRPSVTSRPPMASRPPVGTRPVAPSRPGV